MNKIIESKKDYYPSDFERYLFHEGTLQEGYKLFGSHFLTYNGEEGVRFVVWAPNARSVSVVGDFNHWDGKEHSMDQIENSGIWVLFIKGLEEGQLYKYEIHTPGKEKILKADPYAFYSEIRPNTASVVKRLEGYEWKDKKWMAARNKMDIYHKPMSIYEVHLGTWRQKDNGDFFTYRELADELSDYVADQGFTHVEIMPVMEHPFDKSWGYQITGYYSVSSKYGTPEDFMYLVDLFHQKGIGVILDWVPAHFCKDAHGLAKFDGTPLYEPVDPVKAERPVWGTFNFDYAKPEVVSFLVSNVMFWMDVYHIDGMRVDAVSSMVYLNHDNPLPVPLKNEYGGEENLDAIRFLKQLNEAVFHKYPKALMMAEEATEMPLITAPTDKGGLGFNYKWNMGWTNDILRYMKLEVWERPKHHNLLTFSFFYAFSENFILPFSHDEVVHGKRSLLNKMPGDYWQKFANLRLLYGYFMTHPGKKLLFMGSEFGQFIEWKDEEQLDWLLLEYESHRQLAGYFKSLQKLYKETSCLWRLDHSPEGFEWIDPNNKDQSLLVFMRKGKRKGDYCIIVCNFSSRSFENHKIGVPSLGKYIEIFNSDDKEFGGSGKCNKEPVPVLKKPFHNQRYSMEITVPPLGISIFQKQTKNRKGRVLK
ncbi:1,4-alpha-glucan branching protein GlgB [Bacillus massiliglaciei]|uniref:1,4-alpha-glucan branching protein GlgB n=1 Tax=Bacillus massiliglaciei TaxID=1816693 RepID=UPI000B10A66B|nr:1,4-alpha-glucan branching protein GlgB [Bacillus massiliglaciei]